MLFNKIHYIQYKKEFLSKKKKVQERLYSLEIKHKLIRTQFKMPNFNLTVLIKTIVTDDSTNLVASCPLVEGKIVLKKKIKQ